MCLLTLIWSKWTIPNSKTVSQHLTKASPATEGPFTPSKARWGNYTTTTPFKQHTHNSIYRIHTHN